MGNFSTKILQIFLIFFWNFETFFLSFSILLIFSSNFISYFWKKSKKLKKFSKILKENQKNFLKFLEIIWKFLIFSSYFNSNFWLFDFFFLNLWIRSKTFEKFSWNLFKNQRKFLENLWKKWEKLQKDFGK